ncbi:MAG: glycosyltransferase family 9 protein [Zoogloea sp.]|uniref:glycosyltransferase family 9 protein n=1 Tax=Zoogloea sp. TaxID=49181 RepID=UPI002624E653|nr:glycosyltransferase family 9 protein [Zoogloea sp.]MDD3327072.1 glycosyltransferase family 9 protein [Zoogloea sp.]
MSNSFPPRTVVVIHRTGIGDLIWHIPYLRAIAAASAEGKVSLIVRPSSRAADVLAAESCIAEIIEFDRKPRKSEGRRGAHDSVAAQIGFARAVHERGFERIYILSGRVRYAVLAVLARIPERAGFGFSAAERLLLNRPPYIRPHRGDGNWVYPEITEFCLAHGLVTAPVVPKMAVLPERLEAASRQLAALPWPRYAFSIGTSAPRNNWGQERFAVLAAALARRGCGVLLLGGSAESGAAAAILDALELSLRARVMASTQPSVQHSAALLRACQFCIGNDTSALNMAVANDVPTLGLFGASPPLTHDPLMHALAAPGMSAITVEAVLARLGELAAPGVEAAPALAR